MSGSAWTPEREAAFRAAWEATPPADRSNEFWRAVGGRVGLTGAGAAKAAGWLGLPVKRTPKDGRAKRTYARGD